MAPFARYALLDGEWRETAGLHVPSLSADFLLGEGLFETIGVAAGKPRFLVRHHRRLQRSAVDLALAPVPTCEEFCRQCTTVVARNQIVDGSVKVLLFKNGARISLLVLGRTSTYSEETYRRGFVLKTTGDVRLSGRPAHKSLDYQKNHLARQRAREAGADDALFVTATGDVLEGSATSIFLRTGRTVATPPLEAGILPGIAREVVVELLGSGRVQKRSVGKEELLAADEVFVTNALVGVMPVSAVDGTRWAIEAGSLAQELRVAFAEIAKGEE